jgi:DNA sulfur modification protein DndD
MKISRIHIENFRQHKNLEIELDSSRSSFTIIKGRNGAGKTNLLKAITWVMTGKLAKDELKFDPVSLVSISVAKSAAKGEIIEVLVRLDIDLGTSGLAQIERVARFVKTGEGIQDLNYSATTLGVMTLEDKSRGYQKEGNPELWLEKIFPDRFSHYFLFDGEHLHRFFKDTEAAFVKKAVLEIANIDQLEKLVEHLGIVNQQLVKEIGSIAGVKGEELRKDYEFIEKKIEAIVDELKVKEESRIELDDQLSQAREKMGDIAAIQKDITLRNQLEGIAQSASARGLDARKELNSWAFKVGPALMLSQQIKAVEKEIESARTKKVLPPPYKPEALQELLAQAVCICGRDLEANSDSCKHVESLLAKFAGLSEIGTLLSELQQPLQYVKARVDSSPETLQSTQERIKSALGDESKAMEELSVIKQKLAGHDDAQISFIAKKHDEARKALDSLLLQIGSLERQLEDQKEKLATVRKDIENEAASKEKSREALQRQKFAEATLNTARGMYENFSNQVREKVAEELNEEFQSMIWKKNFFKPVQIDEDYRVLVSPKKFDVEWRNALSAGETACLAFAFSLTLSNVAGFSYPMVVDSPLGKLDEEVKEFVSSVLAKALESEADSEGKQILMLMTDSEYSSDVADAIAYMNPSVFEIIFDQDNAESRLGAVK